MDQAVNLLQHAAPNSDISTDATLVIVGGALVGIAFSLLQFHYVRKVRLDNKSILTVTSAYQAIEDQEAGATIFDASKLEKIRLVYNAIREGADGFLFAEYTRCLAFMVVFAAIGRFDSRY